MARIRTVKPELFRHEGLFEAEQNTGLPLRLAFIGLFCCCDRDGCFSWKPRQLKLDVLPWDETDFSRVLDALATRGFVQRYSVDGADYGCIPSFTRHQVVNNREASSNIPKPPEFTGIPAANVDNREELSTREPRVNHASTTRHGNYQGEGKGREGELEREVERKTAAPIEKSSIGLPLLGGGFYEITPRKLAQLRELYPDLDCPQEMRNIVGWFAGNQDKLKPRTVMASFINTWMAKRQSDYYHSRHNAVNRAMGDLDDTSWADELIIPGVVEGELQ